MKKKILSVFLFLATTLAVNAAQPKKPAKASKTNTTVYGCFETTNAK